MPERMSDNASYVYTEDGDLHPGETVEEKISLSERFGLWITFYPFAQDDYLAAVERWLAHFDVAAPASGRDADERMREALQFALQRGSRSGRVAWQFARHWAGGLGLKTRKVTSARARAP
jgi:predicted AAA+ superfamily ATPase